MKDIYHIFQSLYFIPYPPACTPPTMSTILYPSYHILQTVPLLPGLQSYILHNISSSQYPSYYILKPLSLLQYPPAYILPTISSSLFPSYHSLQLGLGGGGYSQLLLAWVVLGVDGYIKNENIF